MLKLYKKTYKEKKKKKYKLALKVETEPNGDISINLVDKKTGEHQAHLCSFTEAGLHVHSACRGALSDYDTSFTTWNENSERIKVVED